MLKDLEGQGRWRSDPERLPAYHDDEDFDGIVGAYEYDPPGSQVVQGRIGMGGSLEDQLVGGDGGARLRVLLR